MLSPTEDGDSLIEHNLVKVAPLVKSPGYSLQNEDLSVYSDGEDFDSFCPDREWPDEELVNQPAPASTSQPTQPSSPTLTASDSLVKKLLDSHHLQVEVLKSIGVDPCLEYQRGQATFHLAKVRKGDVTCPLCSRKCANAQKLKNHIRARHQEVTAFRCSMCQKSFGDSYSLKVHQEGHRKSVQSKYRCRLCKKGFDTASHLQQHKADHTSQGASCQFCGKKLAHLRSILSHERGCKKNPVYKEQARVRAFKCLLCTAAYFHQKDLNRHMKLAHHSMLR